MGQGTIVPWMPTPTGQKRWRIAVTMADGKRVWRVARSPREAERIRRQLVDARELDLDPSRQTVAGFLRSWIAGLREARNQRIRPRTIEHYEGIVENHLVPALGDLRLSALTPARVQAFLDADGAAPRTVHHHRAVLRRALNVAVRQRLLPYNPAALVEPPRVEREKADPLTADEARRLLEATAGDWLHALWRLALVTGLRQGELLGLAWDDVEADAIVVKAQLQRLSPDSGRRRQRLGPDVDEGRAHRRPDRDRRRHGEVLAEHRKRQATRGRRRGATSGSCSSPSAATRTTRRRSGSGSARRATRPGSGAGGSTTCATRATGCARTRTSARTSGWRVWATTRRRRSRGTTAGPRRCSRSGRRRAPREGAFRLRRSTGSCTATGESGAPGGIRTPDTRFRSSRTVVYGRIADGPCARNDNA
jgi:integrase